MGSSELLKRKEEWLERLMKEGKLRDPTEDHKVGLIALQNRIRRDVIKFISIGGKKSFDEINEKFNLTDAQARMHLDLLEQALFTESVEADGKKYYVLTPRDKLILRMLSGGEI